MKLLLLAALVATGSCRWWQADSNGSPESLNTTIAVPSNAAPAWYCYLSRLCKARLETIQRECPHDRATGSGLPFEGKLCPTELPTTMCDHLDLLCNGFVQQEAQTGYWLKTYLSIPEFTSGNEYFYHYESQVLTGIPQFSKQYGGMKIHAHAKIDFTSSSDAVLQLDEVRVFYLNNEIHNPDVLPPTGQIPLDKFSSLPSDEARLIVEKLQKPIKFSYSNGKVQSIEACTEDSNWSVDQKRSILNMLQVTLQATDFTFTQQLAYNNLEKENSTTFDWLEQGLDGECYSSVQVRQSHENTTQFKVIKSRDETRCLSVNSIRKDVMTSAQRNCQCTDNLNKKNCVCEPEQVEQRNQEDTQIRTVYDVVSTDRQQFLIHKAVQTVQYRHLTPHSPNQYRLTSSNQTLTLIEEKQQQTISISGVSFHQSTSQPWSHQIISRNQEKLMMTDAQLLQAVRDVLSEMNTISAEPERYEDHPAVFYQLISHLRLCNKQQLSTIFTEAKGNDNTSQNKKWKVLIDGMTYVNTTECDKFVLDKIVADEIKNQEASSIFVIWASNKVPTQTIMEYMRVTVLPSLHKQSPRQITYKHAMLSFGSMVRRYIDQEQRNKQDAVTDAQKTQHQSNIDSCRKHEKFVEAQLSAATTEEEKILCLKTVANMGNIKCISQVQKLLERTETNAVRVQAIWAFRHFGQQNQLQTLQSLLPLMNHHQEDSEVRIAAFVMVMKCDPSSSLLEIQKQLNNEQDREYKTFVVRYLKNYLHRKEPGQEQRNSKIRVILRSVRAFHLSEQTTDYEIPYGLNGDEMNGDIVRFSFLSNQTSRFSRAAAFQQLSVTNGVRRHIIEMGYRTEGLEKMFAKLTERSSAVSGEHADLGQLDSLSTQKFQQAVEPSLTVYARVMGQEISFLHLDQVSIMDLVARGLRSSTDGNVEIPVQFFQTIYMKPYQLRKLQPHGMWQIDEELYSGVVDIDGTLKVRMVKGEIPTIRFESTKPVRKEFKTIRAQYVDAGFSISGVSGAMSVRRTINSANMSVTYSPEENKFVFNHTHPLQTNDLASQELRAYTNTIFLPLRLPKVIKSKDVCFRELKTDDSQRRQFTHQFQSMKSVEVEAKVECDVNMPEMYSFVRDRLHFLPTQHSINKQTIKLTVRPATSAQRNFTLEIGARYIKPSELQQMEKQISQSFKQQAQAKQSFFDYLWTSKDSQQEQQPQQQQPSYNQFLKSESLGSLYCFHHFSMVSESSNNVLNMTGNLTQFYEHDFPSTRSLMRFERPPVPSSQEREPVVFVNRMRSIANPNNNELIWANNMTWGERSQSQKPQLTWTMKFTPSYKDSVCWSETAYGCKDQYGEVHPTWYNATHHFTYQNTDNIIERLLNYTKPYIMNSAQYVDRYPDFDVTSLQGRYSVNQTFKPESNRMDIAFPTMYHRQQRQVCIHTNASNVYAPVEMKLYQSLAKTQYPVSQNKPIHDYLPVHHRMNPFESRRDACVIQAPTSYTFDKKEIAMAKTDCEVILAGDCRSTNKQLLVTIKPASNKDQTAERELKTVVGSNKIQVIFTPASPFAAQQMKIKVNDVQRTLDSNQQVVVEESGKQSAIVQCDKIRCEIFSEQYGVFVSIDSERVQVEVNSEKSHQMCGLCAFTPQRSQQLTMTDSLNMFNENKVQNQQCDVEEPSKQEQQQYDTCNKQYKHKIMHTVNEHGQVQTCVSVDRLPTCSTKCASKSIRTDTEQFRCVSRQQAEQLELTPQIEGEELILGDERVLMKMKYAKIVHANINNALQCRN